MKISAQVIRENYQPHESVLAIVGIVSGVMTSVQMASADGNSTPSIVPPQAQSFSLTYAEWGARWWQYVLAIPDNPAPDENPLNAPMARDAVLGNGGQCGSWSERQEGAPRRRCNVPADTGLFSPIQNIFFAISEDGDTPAAIGKLCSDFVSHELRR
jgi:hypothetical protein